jgi:ectoine hydroxylase-related dioxygenase (phytanoyl-CoA dioxygenase family)
MPGSHKFLEDFELPKAADPEAMPGSVRMIAPAGDAWLFNARCYHAAMPNRSDVGRKLLIYSYGHRWMKPRDGYQPSAELQAKATTDVMRQLLHMTDPYPVDHAEIDSGSRKS